MWPHDTGQRIPWSHRCQLTMTWTFNIKGVSYKPTVHGSLSTYKLIDEHHLARLRRRRRRRRAYAPTSNNASHYNPEKIN